MSTRLISCYVKGVYVQNRTLTRLRTYETAFWRTLASRGTCDLATPGFTESSPFLTHPILPSHTLSRLHTTPFVGAYIRFF
jgi:hypothetical protein